MKNKGTVPYKCGASFSFIPVQTGHVFQNRNNQASFKLSAVYIDH